MSRYDKAYLCRCENCDFVFSKKVPGPTELEKYYDTHEPTSYFSPITVARYNELLDQFEPFRRTGKILDIGAGYGFFLEVAKQRGWEVYGTELTEETVKACSEKGMNMFKGELPNIEFEDEMFDVIVMIEVIEHVNNPKTYVEHARRMLRKGGMLYLTTPNFNSLLRYRLKENYNVIEYPNHLCYFTNRTLKKLFAEHRFTTKSISTTGISLTRLRTSKGVSDQDFISETSDDEMVRYKIEKSRFLRFSKKIANFILNMFKVGDSLKGSFIREL